jgi:hypothetical protein
MACSPGLESRELEFGYLSYPDWMKSVKGTTHPGCESKLCPLTHGDEALRPTKGLYRAESG